MKQHRQIVNPRQQPNRRHYNRDHRAYDRDEMRDVSSGGDYYPGNPPGMPNGYSNRDYSNANYNFWPQQDEPQYSNDYAPSRDYGYERDEYYPIDEAHTSYRRGQATGYGNDLSVQGRDFEHWMHEDERRRSDYPANSHEREFREPQRGRSYPHEEQFDNYNEERDGRPHGFSRYGSRDSRRH